MARSKTREIFFDDGAGQATIVVRRQDLFDDLVYRQLVDQGAVKAETEPGIDLQERGDPIQDLARLRANAIQMATAAARRLWWPSVAAVTSSAEGNAGGQAWRWPISLEAFLALPPELIEQWLEAAWELNPEWRPVWATDQAAEEKKAGAPPETLPTG